MITKWLMVTITALFCALASAQTVQPLLQPHAQFTDGSGNPCAGCALYSYVAGSTTPLATYTSSSGLVQNTNPVILDASGSAAIWMGQSAYKFALLDTFGTTLWTVDNVTAPTPGGTAYLPLTGGTLTGLLTAPYFQFTSNPNTCGSGLFVSGWNAGGFICGTPTVGGTAGGDLSGIYPNPTVAKINGAAVPVSATVLGTNGSGQPINQAGTIANNTSGNAATATALAATPTQCSSGLFSTGIAANGNANCANPAGTFVVKAAKIASPCTTTGGGSFDNCSDTLSWPSPFADNGYSMSCSGVQPSSSGGSSSVLALTVTVYSHSITTAVLITQTMRAIDGGFTEIDCVGVHN